MTAVLPIRNSLSIDRTAPSVRPAEPAIGYHRWADLLFIHWRVPAEVMQPLLPAELSLDTWDGDAWVGLVPFHMSRVRPWWSPPVPGISSFCETNVRTYVHFRGRDPGVWFFSLDASNSLAVRIARWRWHLPYYRAEMHLNRTGDSVEYKSRRLWPDPAPATGICVESAVAGCQIRAKIGRPLGHETVDRPLPPGRALPGTLEHFLIERYILYANSGTRNLLSGRVHHSPYPIRQARLEHVDETLLAASGIRPSAPACHTVFCDGVDVEVFPLRPV
jgi:uncharacterized protein YqjF (DUF2071 family)